MSQPSLSLLHGVGVWVDGKLLSTPVYPRDAIMSFVASPSFLCVLRTASDVMWPCFTESSSSLKNSRRQCVSMLSASRSGLSVLHFPENVANNLAIDVFSEVQQLRPRENMI